MGRTWFLAPPMLMGRGEGRPRYASAQTLDFLATYGAGAGQSHWAARKVVRAMTKNASFRIGNCKCPSGVSGWTLVYSFADHFLHRRNGRRARRLVSFQAPDRYTEGGWKTCYRLPSSLFIFPPRSAFYNFKPRINYCFYAFCRFWLPFGGPKSLHATLLIRIEELRNWTTLNG